MILAINYQAPHSTSSSSTTTTLAIQLEQVNKRSFPVTDKNDQEEINQLNCLQGMNLQRGEKQETLSLTLKIPMMRTH